MQALYDYVDRCEDWLWADGTVYQRFLRQRGFDDAVLQANRVGADPGAHAVPRAAGLPGGNPGVVLPCFDESDLISYVVKHPLTGGRSYLLPDSGYLPNPGVAFPRVADQAELGAVVICTDLLDGLSTAQADWPTAVFLREPWSPTSDEATRLVADRYPGWLAMVPEDEPLTVALRRAGLVRQRRLAAPMGGSLNGWATLAGNSFPWLLNDLMRAEGWRPSEARIRGHPAAGRAVTTPEERQLLRQLDRAGATVEEIGQGVYQVSDHPRRD